MVIVLLFSGTSPKLNIEICFSAGNVVKVGGVVSVIVSTSK